MSVHEPQPKHNIQEAAVGTYCNGGRFEGLKPCEFCWEESRGGSQIPEGPVKAQDYPAEMNAVVGCFVNGGKCVCVCVCVAH